MGYRIDLIKSSKGFYRGNYNRVCALLLIVLFIIFLLTALLIYMYINRPIPDFYATNLDGRLTQLTVLNIPNYSNKPLID